MNSQAWERLNVVCYCFNTFFTEQSHLASPYTIKGKMNKKGLGLLWSSLITLIIPTPPIYTSAWGHSLCVRVNGRCVMLYQWIIIICWFCWNAEKHQVTPEKQEKDENEEWRATESSCFPNCWSNANPDQGWLLVGGKWWCVHTQEVDSEGNRVAWWV